MNLPPLHLEDQFHNPMLLRPTLPKPPLFRQQFCETTRSYAVQAPGAATLEVFNRRTKLLQKERAGRNIKLGRKVDYLKDEVAFRLSERLLVRKLFFTSQQQALRRKLIYT